MNPDITTAILDGVQSITAPVWFSRGVDQPPTDVSDSGSCGFVSSGDHRFLVTARHVLEGFRTAQRADPRTVFAVNIGDGNTVVLDEPTVIDESEALDIATVAFPDLAEHQGRTSKTYFRLDQCPPRRALEREPVTIVGFPGQGRQGFETFGRFEPYPITMCISSVSDRRIVLADERETLQFFRHEQYVAEGIELGGFSGSPAIAMALTGQFHLAGIVTDGSTRLGCQGFPGHVCLGSLEYLLPNGTFDQNRMPF